MTATCFQFQQFSLQQDRCAMKLGTDAMVLGAWARHPSALHVLDIGSGTGVLSLMFAQENSPCQIDALEIDLAAVQQARENITASPWAERITVHHQSLQNWQPNYLYQQIICNPPYFQNGQQSSDLSRRQARHDSKLSYADLISHALRLLAPTGLLTLVLPTIEPFLALAVQQGFVLHRHCQIRHSLQHPVRRHLLEFNLSVDSEITQTCQSQTLVLKTAAGNWSPEYKQLTHRFHRKPCEV